MLNKLQRGNKYTLVGSNGWSDFNIQITLIDYVYKQYAQYEAVPYITYKIKGGRKINKMYLNYQYSFIEGWKNIEDEKLIHENENSKMYQLIRYKDLKLQNVLFSGKCGEIEVNRDYDSLIDNSFDLVMKYGRDSEEYITELKKVFTRLNYSLSNNMIEYYKINEPYFVDILKKIS